MIKLNVLIACEESQAECAAFRALGHNAYSCDVQPCRKSGNPYWHIQGDVTPLLRGDTAFITQAGFMRCVPKWDLIVAHPPCTYLCRLSSVLMKKEPLELCTAGFGSYIANHDRFTRMVNARGFFYECLAASAHYVCVENPVPMRMANLPKPTTFACPSWFGVKYTKKTCYWLKNLPPLMPTIYHPHPKCYVRSSRGKYRSRTFPELANALATQFSAAIIEDIKNGLYQV